MSRIHWLAIPAVLATLVLTVSPSGAHAVQETSTTDAEVDVSIRSMNEETLTVRRDKAEVLHLKRDASSVILGNPNLVSITVETPRRLVVVPLAEGMTTLTILDADGGVITERPVVVSSTANSSFVRIRRICPDSGSCEPQQVFFCEEGTSCHNVNTQPQQYTPQQAPAMVQPADNGTAGDGADGEDAVDQ